MFMSESIFCQLQPTFVPFCQVFIDLVMCVYVHAHACVCDYLSKNPSSLHKKINYSALSKEMLSQPSGVNYSARKMGK